MTNKETENNLKNLNLNNLINKEDKNKIGDNKFRESIWQIISEWGHLVIGVMGMLHIFERTKYLIYDAFLRNELHPSLSLGPITPYLFASLASLIYGGLYFSFTSPKNPFHSLKFKRN